MIDPEIPKALHRIAQALEDSRERCACCGLLLVRSCRTNECPDNPQSKEEGNGPDDTRDND